MKSQNGHESKCQDMPAMLDLSGNNWSNWQEHILDYRSRVEMVARLKEWAFLSNSHAPF